MANRWGKSGDSGRFYCFGLQNHCRQWLQPQNEKILALWRKSHDKPRQYIKKQSNHFANKNLYNQNHGISSSHVQMWELDHKEGWAPKNCCFWVVVLENTLESPLDCKEIKLVNPKGNQPTIFIRRTDAEAPILRPSDVKSWLLGKDPDAWKDWGQEEKRVTEDEIVGRHHWLNGYELGQTLGDGEGQGSLVCCSPWGWKELYTTVNEQQYSININSYWYIHIYQLIYI